MTMTNMTIDFIIVKLVENIPIILSFFAGILSKLLYEILYSFFQERQEIRDFCKDAKNLELLEQFTSKSKKGKIRLFSSTKKAINYHAPNCMKLPHYFTNHEKDFLEKSEWFKKTVDGFVLCEKLRRHKRLIKKCIKQNDKILNEIMDKMCSNAMDSSKKLNILLR